MPLCWSGYSPSDHDPDYVEWSGAHDPPPSGRGVLTPHNAALHINPKMWSSTSWDGSGLWVCAKRLEKGRFRWPTPSEKQRSVTMRAEELAMLVNGLDLKQAQTRKWYRRSV